MKRRLVIVVISVGVLILIAGFSYAAYIASGTNPHHIAPGIATSCGTAVPSTGLRAFQITPHQTIASYAVHENLVLRNLPNNVAIGRTDVVQGTFHIHSGASPLVSAMNITVDMRTLKSDEARRDYYVRKNYLESDTYPYTKFVSTCVQDLPTHYNDGQAVRFQIIGNLTLHGKTNKEVFDVQGKVTGNLITGTANSTIYMTDFGIQPPNLANIAIAENKAVLAVTFTAKEDTAGN